MKPELSYRQGVALVVAAGIMWSFMGLFIRLAGDISTWQLLFYRSAGIIPVLALVLAVSARGHVFRALAAGGIAGPIGGACLVGSFAFAISAIQSTTVANAVFLFSATPLMSAVIGRVLIGEAVRPVTWAAIAVALVGVFLMVREGLTLGAGWGNFAALASSALFAVFTVLTRSRGLADPTPSILIGAAMSVATAAVVITARGESFAIAPASMAICLGMGAVILGVGLFIFALGGRAIPAAEMSLLALLEVILGPVWVWLFLGEAATGGTLLGGAVVLAALAVNGAGTTRRDLPEPG